MQLGGLSAKPVSALALNWKPTGLAEPKEPGPAAGRALGAVGVGSAPTGWDARGGMLGLPCDKPWL